VNEAGNTTDARTTERGYLSIGEVLLLLQDEFPDVTISKIRFLESQGLIEPERTPSGYRKFFDTDVERLRYILREQKDHYLPLRVIKHRLDTEPTGPVSRLTDPTDPDGMAAQSDAASRADDEPPGGADPESAGDSPGEEPALVKADLVNADEVRRRTGVTANELRELEQYGIIGSRLLAGEVVYAPGEIEVTRMAVPFLRHGVEPRHLRMYRQAIEREIALFEQIVMPFVKQRNPHARKQAVTTLEELAAAGGELRAALVRNRLQALLEG
jgi:DNA-binding transcriptional MerR regulator